MSRHQVPSRGRSVVFICAGACWVLLLLYAERVVPGERIWLWGSKYDAGQVEAGKIVSHRVWLFNPSLRGLEARISSSCGCTVVSGVRDVSPLGLRPVTIRVDTAGRTVGRQEEVVDVVLQDGRSSWRERLVVRFHVVQPPSGR